MNQSPTEYLYRFEMTFDGEYQACGLFNGLYDVGMSEDDAFRIEQLFHDLSLPICSEPCIFWFTLKGLVEFKSAFLSVIDAISPYGWSLIVAKTEFGPCDDGIIYKDAYQVAFSEKFRPDKPEDYVEITAENINEIVDRAMLKAQNR